MVKADTHVHIDETEQPNAKQNSIYKDNLKESNWKDTPENNDN